jgi:hypothetical protein
MSVIDNIHDIVPTPFRAPSKRSSWPWGPRQCSLPVPSIYSSKECQSAFGCDKAVSFSVDKRAPSAKFSKSVNGRLGLPTVARLALDKRTWACFPLIDLPLGRTIVFMVVRSDLPISQTSSLGRRGRIDKLDQRR